MCKTEWDHPTFGKMKICAAAMDGRFQPHDVKEFCRTKRVFNVVLGEDAESYARKGIMEPHRQTVLDRDVKGKPLVGGMTGYLVNTIYWKRFLYFRINRLREDDPIMFHIPVDRDEMWDRHLQSEREIKIKKRGTNKVTKRWVTRKGFEDNHFLDTVVYALAIANIKGLMKMKIDQAIISALKFYNPLVVKTPPPDATPGKGKKPWINRKIDFRRD